MEPAMQFEVKTEDLRRAAAIVGRCNKFGAKDHRFHDLTYIEAERDVILSTHCGHASWIAHCDATVKAAGTCVVSTSALSKLLAASHEATLKGSKQGDERHLQITIGKGRYMLPTTAVAEEFPPPLECQKEPCRLALKSDDVTRLLVRPQFAVCENPAQLQMGGIFVHMSRANFNDYAAGERLAAVTTDAKTMYWASVPYPEKTPPLPTTKDNDRGFMITRETANEVAAIAKLAGETILEVDAGIIMASTSRAVFSSKLMDVGYPTYTRLWRPTSESIADVSRADLLELFNRMSAADERGIVRMEWKAGRETIAVDFLRSKAEASDEIVASVGGDGKFCSPVWQLIEICEQLSGEKLRISLRKPTEPAFIQDSDDPDVLILQAPSF
jgi:DNA polymerase III sliding clamp (beta) subunit (PCNA family)